jgi:capsular exopolysaccharide synthesis family protein
MLMPDDSPLINPPVPSPGGNGALGGASSRWLRGGADAAGGAADGNELARHLATLRRAKWWVLATGLAGLAAGVTSARYAKPVYEAQATIWVESEPDRSGTQQGPIQQAQLLGSSGWIELLRSYVVLDPVVAQTRAYLSKAPDVASDLFADFALREPFRPGRYRLSVDPTGQTVTLAAEGGAVVERVAVGDSIGRPLGFIWAPPRSALPPGTSVEFGVSSPRDAASALAARLMPVMGERGNFLSIRLEGTDARALAATLNALVERYVQVAGELKRDKLTELVGILRDQLGQAERKLRESESELQRFRVQTITLPSDRATPVVPGLAATRDPVFSSFFDIRIEVEQVRRDREAIQRVLADAGASGLSTDALEGVGAVQHSTELTAALRELTDKRAELRALRYRYTDEHAPLRDLAGAIDTLERRSIPAIAQLVIDALSARERELDQRVQSASRELQQIPPRAIEEARLQRDVEIAGTLYTTLQQRYETARLAEVSSIPDVRVLDRAQIPDRPIKNRAMYFLVAGLVGGLGVGVGGALARDRLDRRVRYPEQVTTGMGLPILGVIPFYRAPDGRTALEAVPVIEALRGIRLNVTHAYGAAGPLVLTVTSPGPGDGKSFVASNLALSFAHAGHRTLLIDGDSRRGSLHRVIRANRKPGLTDVLAGGGKADAVVGQTDYPQLSFLGCGSGMTNAPELLSSPALLQLLTKFRSSYGVIIVDSPPLSAGIDAFALGTATGNLLLVVRTGATDRQLAGAKLEVLDRLPIRILGAVVNGVKDWSGYQYHSYYLPGYQSVAEPAATAAGGKRLSRGG